MTWLTAEQTATYLGLTRQGVYNMTHYNRLPFYRLGKGRIRFAQEDLDEWLKSNRVNTEAENEAEADKALSKMKARKTAV